MNKARHNFHSFGFALLAAGGFICLGAFNGNVLLQHSNVDPEPITAAKLAEAKTAGNWHVRITDYSIDRPLVVKSGSAIKYVECYLIPRGPSTTTIRVQNELVHNEADAEKFLRQDSIAGFLRPPTEFERDRLLDFENVVRVKVTNYPAAATYNDLARRGAILIVCGLAWLGFASWRMQLVAKT